MMNHFTLILTLVIPLGLFSQNDLKLKGHEVFVIFEAVGSRKIQDKEISIKRMINSGIQVVTFEMMLFELLRDSKNKHFKNLSSLIR